ncbi:gamma-glutamylcyclotransferase [Thioclava sp. 15-R06ZXC-3]|uniref:glutathione-specific gamma-glutamylcyclotransferase n=1 Tax=Thioclava arctica TaxID=3238301 RepID=A0ABV3TGE5_9RHOB
MDLKTDPFAHHPELRGKIADPLTSFFRDFSVDSVLKMHPELASVMEWVYSNEAREDTRRHCLADRGPDDLWVFAYGSLMWDPALSFSDVRRAYVPDFARRFILVDDNGGRGTKDSPGLMAALDQGDGCAGLVFRISAQDVERETEILWRREMIGPGYLPVFVTAQIDGKPGRALTFVADHCADVIDADLSRSDQVRLIAHGAGFLGTSKAYLENIVTQFAHLGIVDADCSALLQEVEAFLISQNVPVARTQP